MKNKEKKWKMYDRSLKRVIYSKKSSENSDKKTYESVLVWWPNYDLK